ncbi:hypothetical protein BN946_scf184946.g11 [Trametes cinnabarina]|uniref:Uncharacterized protein n=1 Tax=Pycnoporus cinnabarinus TaxID=5643 RepID=A0A060SYI2_PYCCI|nr:hypothetical protein BN946_scf184946.g11 [Trametes cinnabarina]
MVQEYKRLTPEQREHFLQHGWVKIPKAVKEEYVKAFTENVWIRLGFDPNDKSTWMKEKIHMPRHREVPTKNFMPRAWDAMCELLGGDNRIDPTLFESCGDSLIVNLGSEEWEDKEIAPKDLGNWHIDGDWFTHFLDSGEQGLTVIVLFNDIVPRGGGTYIAPDGIRNVVQWNHLRIPRFITNPPVTLKEPLNLKRDDPADYSLVELKILRTLGVDRLPDWKITSPRRRFTPKTRAGKDATIKEEVERLKAHAEKTGGTVDSMHLNGPVPYQMVVAS